MTVRVQVRKGATPALALASASTTPEGLPDVTGYRSTHANARLLWEACRTIAEREGAETVIRDGRLGYRHDLSVSVVMGNLWDAYQPTTGPSVTARQALYHHLRATGNMICISRNTGRGGGTWWIAGDWDDAPPPAPDDSVMLSRTERRITPQEAGETRRRDMPAIQYVCKFPGCSDPRPFQPKGMGRHVSSKHGLTGLTVYLQMLAGDIPWASTAAKAKIVTAPIHDTKAKDDTASPHAALASILQENTSLRAALTEMKPDDSGEAAELRERNAQLARDNAELRESNTRLRQKVAAIDRMMGRR